MLTERGDIGGPRQPTLTLTIACEQCGADIVTYDKARRWCSAECKYDAQVIRVGRPIERGERHCIDCDADISHVWARRRCRDCDVKRMKDQARASGDKGRARYYGVPYEYVSRRKVYDRDGWQCGICSELIDRTLAYPDPRSASLDHVIPISLGGPHTAANCQAAHLSCNVGKSNRVGDELDVESAGRA
jgi:5-methylcytosine-specific restriction endonuclease McrA